MGAQSDIPLKQEEFEITETTGLWLRKLCEKGPGVGVKSGCLPGDEQLSLKPMGDSIEADTAHYGVSSIVFVIHSWQQDFAGPLPV